MIDGTKDTTISWYMLGMSRHITQDKRKKKKVIIKLKKKHSGTMHRKKHNCKRDKLSKGFEKAQLNFGKNISYIIHEVQ